MPGIVSVGRGGPLRLEMDICSERVDELRCASDVRAFGWAAFM